MNRPRTIIPIFALAVVALALAGCDMSPTRPSRAPSPEPMEIQAVSGQAKGGNGGGNSGGGAQEVGLALSGVMAVSEQQVPIQLNNKKELNVQGPMDGVVTTIPEVGCQLVSGTSEQEAHMRSALNEGPFHSFRVVMVYDKRANGGSSDRHRITINVNEPAGVGQFRVAITGEPTVANSGDTYLYSGGIVRVTTSGGSPQEQGVLECPNTSVVTATVTGL